MQLSRAWGTIVVVDGGFGLAKIKLFGWLWVETGRDHDAQTTKLTARARATAQQGESLHHTCAAGSSSSSASCRVMQSYGWTAVITDVRYMHLL